MAGIGNLDYVKKIPGILKLCQIVLGIICLSLSAHYSIFQGYYCANRSQCFFLIVTVQFFTGTLLLVINGLSSVNAEERMRQTLFEPMFHLLAVIFYFSGSVAVLADTERLSYFVERRDGFLAAGSLGIINTILYGASTFDSYKAYVYE